MPGRPGEGQQRAADCQKHRIGDRHPACETREEHGTEQQTEKGFECGHGVGHPAARYRSANEVRAHGAQLDDQTLRLIRTVA